MSESNNNDGHDKSRYQPPSAGDKPELRPHVYDGIEEYDQKLPNWWLWTLYVTIIFFFIYWVVYYQAGAFSSDGEKMASEFQRIEDMNAAAMEQELGVVDNAKLWELSQNDKFVAEGRKQFMVACSACHGTDLTAMRDGVKLSGVPLNDSEWLYGGQPMDLMNIVVNGSPDKKSGMQAWGPVIGESQIVRVVAFVMSHHEAPADVAAEEPEATPES